MWKCLSTHTGVSIENCPPSLGRELSADVISGKKIKRGDKKGENVREKRIKGKEKGERGKRKEKMGSKRVK